MGARGAGTTSRACGCSAPWVSPSTPRRGCGTRSTSRGPVPDRRHVVADRDRGADDLAAPRGDHHQARFGHLPAPRHRRRGRGRRRQQGRAGRRVPHLTRPWPGMLRGIYGDPERYKETYWSRFEGRYFAGDGAKIDEDGYFWLLGRVDDVMNVSGHRVSTTGGVGAGGSHVGGRVRCGRRHRRHDRPAIVGYVILRGGNEPSEELGEELRQHVANKIGPTARPKTVVFVPDLPKTRSGKIMRRPCATWSRTGAGRHHHAGRRVGGRGDPGAGGLRRPRRGLTAQDAPGHWRWRTDRVEPGPAGFRHGRRAVRRRRPPALPGVPRRDWEAFFAACGDDKLIDEVARLLDLLQPELSVILLTARPLRVQPQTLAWLDRYALRWDLLIMREHGDYLASRHFKQRTVGELREAGFDLRLAFEDDLRNYEMFHDEGVPHLHPLGLLRLSVPRPRRPPASPRSGSSPVASGERARRPGRSAPQEDFDEEHLQDLHLLGTARWAVHGHRRSDRRHDGPDHRPRHRPVVRRWLVLVQQHDCHQGRPGEAGHRAGDARVLRHVREPRGESRHADAQALRHAQRLPPAATRSTLR